MKGIMDGVRVLEVAAWTYVPAAGAVLAEWGADVLKVEHPETGDPQRGLVNMGLVPKAPGDINHMIELPNRGKRSVAIDMGTEAGREALLKLAATSDVFLTELSARRPQEAADRRRGHPRGQSEHHLRAGIRQRPGRSRTGERRLRRVQLLAPHDRRHRDQGRRLSGAATRPRVRRHARWAHHRRWHQRRVVPS